MSSSATAWQHLHATPHACDRFQERYGTPLQPHQALTMVQDVQAGRGLLLSRYEDGCERWCVAINAEPVHIVVNPSRSIIITVLPRRPKRRTRRSRGFSASRARDDFE